MIIDSHIDLAGFVASEPAFRRLENGTSTAKLRVAYTERRFNRESGEWADGPTSFVSVLCWRTLADNVAISLRKGEPVVVRGRLRVREYEGKEGTPRIAVEVEASSVGHDLSRGVAHFSRTRRAPGETAAGNAEALAAPDLRGGNGHPAGTAGGDGTAGNEPGMDEPGMDGAGLGGAGGDADGPDRAGDGVLDEHAVAEFASELTGSLGGVPA
ncbi:MAG TPA: single-stranded DNA-binding protein [Streptosporangiaceae bacterium]|jgi:single-strand DNA-binding protein|nr:single-stranded DNA-binding protein [Streptosporangiaceae bacterium]